MKKFFAIALSALLFVFGAAFFAACEPSDQGDDGKGPSGTPGRAGRRRRLCAGRARPRSRSRS